MRRISSRQNPCVRELRALASSPDPAGRRLLLDGAHLVRDAHRAGLRIETVAIAASRTGVENEEGALARRLEADGADVIVAGDEVFAAISPSTTPSGIVAVAQRNPASIEEVVAQPGVVLVAVDVQDPGNLGAMLRAAEAGGAGGALVSASRDGASANPFSWKALRGSMGSALRLPISAPLSVDAALEALRDAGARVMAAVPRGGQDPDDADWSGRVALLLGGEGPGVPPAIVARCDSRVTVPMAEGVESLNVAVATGILIYAARRQRTSGRA